MADIKRVKKAINWLISQGELTSQKELGQKIGIENKSYLSQLVNSEKPSEDFVNKFVGIYPVISKSWLLTGEGEMIKKNETNSNVKAPEPFLTDNLIKVRLLEISPTATFTAFASTPPAEYDFTYVYPVEGEVIDDDDVVFSVRGDSMYPTIADKSRILGKLIPKSQWHWARGIVIIAFNESFVVKRIADNRLDLENYLILESDNPDFPGKMKVSLASIHIMFQADRIVFAPLR